MTLETIFNLNRKRIQFNPFHYLNKHYSILIINNFYYSHYIYYYAKFTLNVLFCSIFYITHCTHYYTNTSDFVIITTLVLN